MDNPYALPMFGDEERKEAENVLGPFFGDAVKNKLTANGCVLSSDFKAYSLKNSRFVNCEIRDCIWERCALNGSAFKDTVFSDCRLSGDNFMFSTFNRCDFFSDASLEVTGSNFSQCVFIQSVFKNVYFQSSSMAQTLFLECTFIHCTFQALSLENARFSHCTFEDVDMSSLNLHFAYNDQSIFHNTVLPFFQVPYIIGGMRIVRDCEDTQIAAHCKRMDAAEYAGYYRQLCIHFDSQKEYFPLTNLYLTMGDPQSALAALLTGIEDALHGNDYRMVEYFCKLGKYHSLIDASAGDRIVRHMDQTLTQPQLNDAERISYLSHAEEIRSVLMDFAEGKEGRLEIVFHTDIGSHETAEAEAFVRELNLMLRPEEGVMHSIEMRHNSPFVFLVELAGTIKNVLEIGAAIVTIVGGVAKAVSWIRSKKLSDKEKNRLIKKAEATEKQSREANPLNRHTKNVRLEEHTKRKESSPQAGLTVISLDDPEIDAL